MIPLSPLTIRISSTEIKVHISLGNKTYKLNLLFLTYHATSSKIEIYFSRSMIRGMNRL